MFSVKLLRKVDTTEPKMKVVLLSLMDEIEQKYATERKIDDLSNFVKTEVGGLKTEVGGLKTEVGGLKTEFGGLKTEVGELKEIVRELAEAQKRTEKKVGELADVQKRTEKKVGELADAQRNTEKEIAKLSAAIGSTREHLGGLSKSVAYSLENEAYRKLPSYLREHFQIDITERFIRTFVEGEEINILAAAKRNGEDVMIVGETVLKLDDRSKMKQLNKKVKVVAKNYDKTVIPMIITHFAKPDILKSASDTGVLVVQSFEWD